RRAAHLVRAVGHEAALAQGLQESLDEGGLARHTRVLGDALDAAALERLVDARHAGLPRGLHRGALDEGGLLRAGVSKEALLREARAHDEERRALGAVVAQRHEDLVEERLL